MVRGVKPDQLEASTPCEKWDVRLLLNHILQVDCALGLAGAGQPVSAQVWDRDLITAGDWANRFDEEARAASAAWAKPEAWNATVGFGGMPMPATMAATMLISDLAIHGWDLARATGQDYRCDDDVAQLVHQFVGEMGEQGRQMGIYAAPLPVAEGASVFSRSLSLSGRDPQWQGGA